LRAPGAAAVGGALEEQIDVAGVTTTRFTALGEGEEIVVFRADDGRDAIGMIAVAAGDVDVGFFDNGGGGRERNRGNESQQRGEQGTGEPRLWGRLKSDQNEPRIPRLEPKPSSGQRVGLA
jgi:hypothetical protein